AFMLLPKTPIGKRLMLAESQTKEAGFEPQGEKDRDLVGKEGVSLSALRPSGEARIDGRRYDVVTEGDLIEPGTKIVVHKADGNRIVVRRAEPEADP
ncbi:MAG: NfeD family protein, partial [Planctomycetota bacterium]